MGGRSLLCWTTRRPAGLEPVAGQFRCRRELCLVGSFLCLNLSLKASVFLSAGYLSILSLLRPAAFLTYTPPLIWFPRAFGTVTGLQVCGRIMQRGSHRGRGWSQAEKGKPLLKCHSEGGEVREPGPSMRGWTRTRKQVNQRARKWSVRPSQLEDA